MLLWQFVDSFRSTARRVFAVINKIITGYSDRGALALAMQYRGLMPDGPVVNK